MIVVSAQFRLAGRYLIRPTLFLPSPAAKRCENNPFL